MFPFKTSINKQHSSVWVKVPVSRRLRGSVNDGECQQKEKFQTKTHFGKACGPCEIQKTINLYQNVTNKQIHID